MDAPDAAADPFATDPEPPPFWVERPEPGRVEIHGEVDAATAGQLDAAIVAATAAGGSDVVVDCARLEFIDSSGLSVLVTNHQRLSAQSRTLVILRPPPAAVRLFEIAGLDRVLTIR